MILLFVLKKDWRLFIIATKKIFKFKKGKVEIFIRFYVFKF